MKLRLIALDLDGTLLTRKVFTTARNVREPEILRGIEAIGK